MSIKLMSLVWDMDLESTRKLLLLKLADYANDDGQNVYPKVGTLAEKTGISKRTVQRIVREFQANDLLIVEEEAIYHSSTKYRLNLKRLRGDTVTSLASKASKDARHGPELDEESLRGDTVTSLPSRRGVTVTPHGVTPDAHRGDTVTPLLINEPSIEPPVRTKTFSEGAPEGAHTIVAAFVDAYRQTHRGEDPVKDLTGRVARWAKQALSANKPFSQVKAVVERAARENKSPGLLSNLLADEESPTGQRPKGHQPYRDPDPSEYERVVL